MGSCPCCMRIHTAVLSDVRLSSTTAPIRGQSICTDANTTSRAAKYYGVPQCHHRFGFSYLCVQFEFRMSICMAYQLRSVGKEFVDIGLFFPDILLRDSR